jgi:hypothetical protein
VQEAVYERQSGAEMVAASAPMNPVNTGWSISWALRRAAARHVRLLMKKIIRVTLTALLVTGLAPLELTMAQRSGSDLSLSGGGPLSPSVIATWEAHADSPVEGVKGPPTGPVKLDLLVLWRGTEARFAEAEYSAGGSDHLHRIVLGDRSVELRLEPASGRVILQHTVLTLAGANVLLLDVSNGFSAVAVVGRITVDSLLAPPPAKGGGVADPMTRILRPSQELRDFLRCPPLLSDKQQQRFYCHLL